MNSLLEAFELSALRHFYAIAHYNGFSRASRATGVSQPALSSGLKRLEDSLKTKLIIRSPGEFRLSDTGAIVFDFCRKLEGNLLNLVQEIQSDAPLARERVRIGTAFSIGYGPLAPLFETLLRGGGSLDAEVISADSYRLVKDLHEGAIDAALLPDDVQSAGLRFVNVVKDQVILVSTRAIESTLRGADGKTRLQQIPLITYPRDTPMRAVVDRICVKERLHFRSQIAVDGAEPVKGLVILETGVGFLLRSAAAGELASGKLTELQMDLSLPRKGIALATRAKDDRLSARLLRALQGVTPDVSV